MNHRDAEDAEEALKRKFLRSERSKQSTSNNGLVENDQYPLRALRLRGSSYRTNCFISIYHSVALVTNFAQVGAGLPGRVCTRNSNPQPARHRQV